MNKERLPIVIIVDDDPDDQLLLKSAFEDCGHNPEVLAFEDGQDLLAHLWSDQQLSRPDLIIIDPHLSGDSGFDLLERIKSDAVLRNISVIALTSIYYDAEISRCYELGANTVITKPNSYGELLDMVKKLCEYWFGAIRM
jgi:CheY-like chemotaxis protein